MNNSERSDDLTFAFWIGRTLSSLISTVDVFISVTIYTEVPKSKFQKIK